MSYNKYTNCIRPVSEFEPSASVYQTGPHFVIGLILIIYLRLRPQWKPRQPWAAGKAPGTFGGKAPIQDS